MRENPDSQLDDHAHSSDQERDKDHFRGVVARAMEIDASISIPLAPLQISSSSPADNFISDPKS